MLRAISTYVGVKDRLHPAMLDALVKGGAHVTPRAEDDAVVEALIAGASTGDRELAIARTGCALLDAVAAI